MSDGRKQETLYVLLRNIYTFRCSYFLVLANVSLNLLANKSQLDLNFLTFYIYIIHYRGYNSGQQGKDDIKLYRTRQ